jgi:hypothetical protein
VFRERVSEPEDVPPIDVEGHLVPALGWRDGDLAYAFTSVPGPTGRYHVGKVRLSDGKRMGGWNVETRTEAEEDAARLYWQKVPGSRPETFADLAKTRNRFDYWRIRKESLGGGELYGQVEQLMAEIVPLDELGGHRLRVDPRMQPPTIELLAGQDYQHSIRGSGAEMIDAVADLLANVEAWVAKR